MVDKNMAEAINRLRGVSTSDPIPARRTKTVAPTPAPVAPAASVAPKSQPTRPATDDQLKAAFENSVPKADVQLKAAFESLMEKAPADNTPDSEKKYTMEDLNNFLATLIPEE